MIKTADRDAFCQFWPTVLLNQARKDHFKRNAVQGVIGLGTGYHMVFILWTPAHPNPMP